MHTFFRHSFHLFLLFLLAQFARLCCAFWNDILFQGPCITHWPPTPYWLRCWPASFVRLRCSLCSAGMPSSCALNGSPAADCSTRRTKKLQNGAWTQKTGAYRSMDFGRCICSAGSSADQPLRSEFLAHLSTRSAVSRRTHLEPHPSFFCSC